MKTYAVYIHMRREAEVQLKAVLGKTDRQTDTQYIQ
jgi:hypothetical protein